MQDITCERKYNVYEKKSMKAGVAFDIYSPLFTTKDVAEICGVNRATLDIWLQRGLITPAGRAEKISPKARTKGRPYFSAREIFKVELLRAFAADLLLGLTDYAAIAEKAKIAETIAETGEWMWSVARSVEKGRTASVYAYATRVDGDWIFDTHVGKIGGIPCFGWDVPHVFVPMSAIFASVYLKCKRVRVGNIDEMHGEDD
jgi:hypothetical protein